MKAEKAEVYAASHLGFTAEGRLYYRRELLPKLRKAGVRINDPWRELLRYDEEIIVDRLNPITKELGLKIGRKNFSMIDRSDAVFACLNGTDADSGTSTEIGYAYAKGKKIIAYRDDLRLTGDSPEIPVNLQVATAIYLSGGDIYGSLEDAAVALENMIPELLKSRIRA